METGITVGTQNGNGIGDFNEDVNRDSHYYSLDCAGPEGPQGERGLTGHTGPQGEQGIQGKQGLRGLAGADGADGQDGISGYERISEMFTLAGGTFNEFKVPCPAGKKVFGGGYRKSSGDVVILDEHVWTDDQWFVTFRNNGGIDRDVWVYAVCATAY